jgi:thioredoxin reductase
MGADWEVVVVGRSFAGLSAALTLGRMRRSVLVIGSGGPRNSAVLQAHGLLTRDGANPNQLVIAAEADLDSYPSVELIDGRVTALNGENGRFQVRFEGRTSTASKVILATGVNDDPVPIPGLAEHWGRGVFTCPFCDGFEYQDLPLAMVGDPLLAAHGARLLRALSDRVTLYASGLGADVRATLVAADIAIEDRAVVRVVGDGSVVSALELDDGTRNPTAAVFAASMAHPNNQLAMTLGCSVEDLGYVTVDATGRSSVDGVWAAGDLTTMRHQISIAVAQGTIAAADCAMDLILG